MIFGARVHIRKPDAGQWRQAFPDGLGASAFSSPGFQRAILDTEPSGWVQRAVSVDGSDLWLPVLGRRDRVGRWELRVLPVAYDVMPVQRARLSQAELDTWIDALCTPRISHFIWWLPPWHTDGLHIEPRRHLGGGLTVGSHRTYVIRLDGTADEHLERNVSTTMRRYVRRNDKAGVTVVAKPDAAQIDAYFGVYQQSFHDNGWVGEMFPRRFLDAAARTLGLGGELAVVLHEGQVVGGGILMFDRDALHYFQGAIDRGVKDINPHVALYTYALRCAEARGIRHVNLGGVNDGNEGLMRFKTSWGAEATSATMLTFTSGARYTWAAIRERLPSERLARLLGGGSR